MPESFCDMDFALFAGTEGAKGAAVTYANEAIKRGAVVIDNGADFRMKKSVPLVVPEVNGKAAKGHKGISAFVVEADRQGFVLGKKEPKLGIRASATSEIVFEDLQVPSENRIGEEGEGFKIAMAVLDAGRIGIATQALGLAEAAYKASVEYAMEREAFGKKIGH